MSSDSQSKLDALDAQLEALLLQRLALVEEQRVDQPAKKAAPPLPIWRWSREGLTLR